MISNWGMERLIGSFNLVEATRHLQGVGLHFCWAV